MSRNTATDVASLIIVLAIITVMLAPRSQGPGLVQAFGQAFAGIIHAANSPGWA